MYLSAAKHYVTNHNKHIDSEFVRYLEFVVINNKT